MTSNQLDKWQPMRRTIVVMIWATALAWMLVNVNSIFAQSGQEDPLQVVEQIEAATISGDLTAIAPFYADDFTYHSNLLGRLDRLFSGGVNASDFALLSSYLSSHTRGLTAFQIIPVVTSVDDATVFRQVIYNGIHSGLYQNLPAQGNPVAFTVTDAYRFENGQIVEQHTNVDRFTLIEQLTSARPRPDIENILPTRVHAEFTEGDFFEGVTTDQDGNLYVTAPQVGTQGGDRIYKVTLDGEVSVFVNESAGTLAFGPDGLLYGTKSNPMTGESGIQAYLPDGSRGDYYAFPAGAVPNGITIDADNRLYAADSFSDLIWQLDLETGDVAVWLDHPLLKRRPFITSLPGPNGIVYHENAIYTAISDSGDIARTPIGENGEAGEPEVYASDVPGDGIGFDDQGNLYVTAHLYNQLLRVKPDGTRELIAGYTQGMNGPTDVVFSLNNQGQPVVYVVTDGRWFEALDGVTTQEPAYIVEVRLD